MRISSYPRLYSNIKLAQEKISSTFNEPRLIRLQLKPQKNVN